MKKFKILSKTEMKKVAGGSGGCASGTCFNPETLQCEVCDNDGFEICKVSLGCELFVRPLNQTYPGSCYYQLGGTCFCGVTIGDNFYITDPASHSTCWW